MIKYKTPINKKEIAYLWRCYNNPISTLNSKYECIVDIARQYYHAKKYKEAINTYNIGLENKELSDRAYGFYSGLAKIYEDKGDFKTAKSFYISSLIPEQHWTACWTYNSIGFCCLMLKEFEEARDYCKQAVQLNLEWDFAVKWLRERNSQPYRNLAIAEENLGNLFSALSNYVTAVKVSPYDLENKKCFNRFKKKHKDFTEKHFDILDNLESYCKGEHQIWGI